MKCVQANLQHAKAASAEISRGFAKNTYNIGLIQEPWIRSGKISGLNIEKCKLIYDMNVERPRAAIILDENINSLLISEFTDGDLVTILTEANQMGVRKEIIIASAYFPGEQPEAPTEKVKALVGYCRKHNKSLIIGCDANAHNKVWGSTDTNKRGESILDFLMTNNIAIANRGKRPTFENAIRQEVIDLTIVSHNIQDMIKDWRVSQENSFSDHKHIFFELKTDLIQKIWYRSPKATNWEGYKSDLEDRLKTHGSPINSSVDLDESVDKLTDDILGSYENNCPLKNKNTNRNVRWWNKTVEKLRRLARQEFNRAKSSNNWQDYKNALTKYNKELRKSKRSSWKTFCGELKDVPETARIQKALSSQKSQTIGTLRIDDANQTSSFGETLELLLKTHFPGCRFDEGDSIGNYESENTNNFNDPIIKQIITYEKIEWSINSFKPYKSPGPDGIFPAMLINGPDSLSRRLVHVFRASLALNIIPTKWKKVQVVFLPKGGNKPADHPKSYRPISLSSFMLKTMEKLIDLYIRNELLTKRPLHNLQFAYQKGKSTITSIHKLTSIIEKALERKEIALCSFMDIEGAFDNASYKSMEGALIKRESDPIVIKWVNKILSQRQIIANIGNTSRKINTIKGCPQGGVLSPLLWSILVDELLVKLNGNGFTTVGYADDITVIVEGTHDNTIGEQMQNALKLTWEWCENEGLSINPNKTTIIPFTKRRTVTIPTLHIKDTEVQFEQEVKYLGIMLDRTLSWNPHLNMINKKATKSIWASKQLLGKTWGLSPKMSLWIYKQMVLPSILYGSVIWWQKTTQTTAQNKLSKTQRLACLNITGAMRTTPTAALEVILNLDPLHLAIQGEAFKQAIELHKLFKFKEGDHTGHLEILNKANHIKEMTLCSDQIEPVLELKRNYTVLIPKRTEWDSNPIWLREGAQKWFTDGSKTTEGVGAGIVGPRCRLQIPLSNDSTIFTAELHALNTATETLLDRNLTRTKINIMTDSQAVLKALNKPIFHHKSVLEGHRALNQLAEHNKVTLVWVPGHSGIDGNDLADERARLGAQRPFIGPNPQYGFTKKDIITMITKLTKGESKEFWIKQGPLKHSKKFLSPNEKRSKDALRLNRPNLRLLCGALTGHYTCNYMLNKMQIAEERTCRYCLEDDETMEHILAKCPAFAYQRFKIFGGSEVMKDAYKKLAVKDIVKFLNNAMN